MRLNVPPASSSRKFITVVIQKFKSNRPGVCRNAILVLLLVGLPAYAANFRNPPAVRTRGSLPRYSVDLLDRPDQPSGHYLCGASGSIPRSILAIRSWCLSTSTVIATPQPPRIATIGISSGPKPRIDSMKSPLRRLALDAVRMNPALDHRQPLLMAKNQLGHRNDTADDDCSDRYEEHPKPKMPSTSLFTQTSVTHERHRRTTADVRFSGGADRDRTGGLLVANQALSQLSYSPITQWSVVSCQWSEDLTAH
jgi:hypothetical protein